jgi:hypothetical protein
MTEVAAIIGAISGGLSFLGIVYLAGYWKGKVDTDLKFLKHNCEEYPPSEMSRMLNTMWEIYVVDALGSRPDLATHSSAYKLRKEGEDIIPDDIKQELDRLRNNEATIEDIASGYLVVKKLGAERISKMAEARNLSVQEAVAILSLYLDNRKS